MNLVFETQHRYREYKMFRKTPDTMPNLFEKIFNAKTNSTVLQH